MKEIVTNDGKKGGWLKGKPHYDKDGKPLGGIKAVVTDAGGKPVELEGGEVIINKEASAKHWKELSRINQSAGNGVAIGPPSGDYDEDPEEYKEGGKVIEFNANHVPNKWILNYAKNIKEKHPEIWKLGGNIFGNQAFINLKRVSERGYWLDSEKWMYIKWRSYVARHKKDFRIEGVVAMLKWVDKVDKGWAYMKDLIEERIDKIKDKKEGKGWKHKMKNGGGVNDRKGNIKFMEWYVVWYKKISDKINITFSLPHKLSPFKEKNVVILDLFETTDQNIDAKPYLEKIVNKADEYGVTIYLEPMPRYKFSYYQKFGFELTADKNFMKRLPKSNTNEIGSEVMKSGGKTIAQTPAPKKERIYGSKVNKPESAASESKAKSIKLSDAVIESIKNKIKGTGISLATAKAVVRRGMGAYSSSHRPTITGGKPNSRVAWGLARLNAFLYKAEHGKSKSGKYTQDDDLLRESGFNVNKYHLGGDMSKHLAPNGKPSNLTHEQWHLVRTPEFKAWFGDWERAYETGNYDNVSKVIDEETKEPLVVWHGTNVEFNVFDVNKTTNKRFHFTTDREYATFRGGISKAYFLKIYNLTYENWGDRRTLPKPKGKFVGFGNLLNDIKNLKEVIVFEPNQIKLADGTNTTFDGSNPDIRYAEGGQTFYERTYADGTKKRFSVDEYEKNIYPYLPLGNGGNVDIAEWETKEPELFKCLLTIRELVEANAVVKDSFIDTHNNIYIIKYEDSNPYFNSIITETCKTLTECEDYLEVDEVEVTDKFVLVPLVKKANTRYKDGSISYSCNYFKEKTTGLPYYDDILNGKNNITEYKIVNMPIDDYFKLIRDEHGISYTKEVHLDKFGMQKEKLPKIIDQMKMGVKYDMPVYDFRDGFQEGRHRLIAASNIGCKSVNVALFGNNIDLELHKLGINYSPNRMYAGGGELAKGIKTEQEHRKTLEKIASGELSVDQAIERTAKDHLKEDPNYYTKLLKMEGKMANGGGVSETSYKLNTPTGEPTKLTYMQQVLVRTQTFKKWFGDWESAAKMFIADNKENFKKHYKGVSKVLDMTTLEPRVVFHGTRSEEEFFMFDVSKEKGIGRPYAYFAHNIEYSRNFTQFSQRGHQRSRGFLYQCFLNIKNPFMAMGQQYEMKNRKAESWKDIITGTIAWDKYGAVTKDPKTENLELAVDAQISLYLNKVAQSYDVPFWNFMARDISSDFKYFLVSYGYDGIFYTEEIATDFDPTNPAQYTKAVTVFNPSDIKLADGRNLNFNPMEADIRMEEGGEVEQTPASATNKKEQLGNLLFGDKYASGGSVDGIDKIITQAPKQELSKERKFVDELIKKMKNGI